MREISTAGVIGYGSAGQHHERAYDAAGLTVRVFDPAHEDGDSLDEVLACDVVSICSPDDTHFDYLTVAMERGAHVLCEKPITHKLAELGALETIIRANDGQHGILECHLPLRYHPPFVRALGEVKSGSLGKIISIDMAYHYGRPEKMQGWRGKMPGYSLIVGGGIHLVDLACQMLDSTHLWSDKKWATQEGWDTRAIFTIDATLCTLATSCHEHVPHMRYLGIIGTNDCVPVRDDTEVDYAKGVRIFLDKVRNGQRGNIAEAIAANKICIQLAEALR